MSISLYITAQIGDDVTQFPTGPNWANQNARSMLAIIAPGMDIDSDGIEPDEIPDALSRIAAALADPSRRGALLRDASTGRGERGARFWVGPSTDDDACCRLAEARRFLLAAAWLGRGIHWG